jgi:diaminohydroxyphosphoribosylaminopyrimidine deaminase/5-amino-6-(5-phosphoribosylamino)uracil reductase
MEDPNPLVSGRGVELLRQAGMDVVVGLLEKECRKLNEAFCKYIVKKEPFIILKVAATLDGKIATQGGESKWISNEASRRFVHRLRDQVDGILVGIGTILKDDPQLTARFKGGRNPYRIVVDSRLRIPEEAKVIETSPSLTILATTEQAPEEKRERLEKKGVRVLILDSKEGRVDLKSCLSELGEMGMMTLMVEGGSRINGSFLDEGLADKVLLFFSPRLLGDPQATGMFGGRGAVGLSEANFLKDLKVRKIGEDLLLEGSIVRRTGVCSPGS